MSNLWINIRIGTWHFKLGSEEVSISKNHYWMDIWETKPFEVIQLFGLERLWR